MKHQQAAWQLWNKRQRESGKERLFSAWSCRPCVTGGLKGPVCRAHLLSCGHEEEVHTLRWRGTTQPFQPGAEDLHPCTEWSALPPAGRTPGLPHAHFQLFTYHRIGLMKQQFKKCCVAVPFNYFYSSLFIQLLSFFLSFLFCLFLFFFFFLFLTQPGSVWLFQAILYDW